MSVDSATSAQGVSRPGQQQGGSVPFLGPADAAAQAVYQRYPRFKDFVSTAWNNQQFTSETGLVRLTLSTC